jgi:hypothetical protein
MTRRTPRGHEWYGATEIRLHDDQAEAAARAANAEGLGKWSIPTVTTLTVIDVYCRRCRRSWEASMAAEPCRPGMIVRGGPRTEDV